MILTILIFTAFIIFTGSIISHWSKAVEKTTPSKSEETKTLRITVTFPAKYSYRSVADEVYCKLGSLKEYYNFKVSVFQPKFTSEKECEEGEKFVDW